MKTLKLTAALLLISVVCSYAQNIPMNMFEQIQDEQVPAAVLKTFEEEFGQVKDDIKKGVWYAHFEHTSATTGEQSYGSYVEPSKPMALPLHYTYQGKKAGKKVEIKFTPDGKLVYAKGLDQKSQD
ncbi:MAG TPA: hypothetical protein PKJ63_00300 [Cyclobacteriaceae bacterium]|nr:hypothetical protein [Cyclobacteriaceae bacterium]